MHKILVIGAGKIGSLIAVLFALSEGYDIYVADLDFTGTDFLRLQALFKFNTITLNVQDEEASKKIFAEYQFDAVISCLPYFCNLQVARRAKEFNVHYFDLTEDTQVAKDIKALAKDAQTAFVPQCGLAPGFTGIVTNDLMKNFTQVDKVKLRVGSLPVNANNALQYALTWSTDGLINEYGNPCYAIENKKQMTVAPLEGYELIQIDGSLYEAFNTSGGLGGLTELYEGKVNTLNYKTLRYPGHCEKMRLLMNDLKLNQDRGTLKRILENAIPKTYQDVVVVYVAVTGIQGGVFMEESYVKKIYSRQLAGLRWSAIQSTTASSLCAIVDMVLSHPKKYSGFIYQEKISLKQFLGNRFGKYYSELSYDK